MLLVLRRIANRREVAESAIYAHKIDSEYRAFGEPDRALEHGFPRDKAARALHAGFAHEAKGVVPRLGVRWTQSIGDGRGGRENSRQYFPDPVRNRRHRQRMVGTDGAVFVLRSGIGEIFRHSEARAPQCVARNQQHRDGEQPEKALEHGSRLLGIVDVRH